MAKDQQQAKSADGSQMLDNEAHEAFAQAISWGSTGIQAYRDNVAQGCTTKTAMEEASKLLHSPKVSPRVAHLRKLAQQIATERHAWDKERAIAYLIEVMETPISEISADHRLAQEMTRDEMGNEEDGAFTRVKLKSFGKAEASKQLAALCGWNEPDKIEHSGPMEIVIRKM